MKNKILTTEIDYITGKNETSYNPDNNLRVADGLALASRLHAAFNGSVVKAREGVSYEHRIDFDDPSFIVDLMKRNSRNNNGVNVIRGVKGEIRDSMLVVDVTSPDGNGIFNPQFTLNGLELNAKNYNKITIRMKIDADVEEIKNEQVRVYFKTSTNSTLSEERSVFACLNEVENTADWFEVVIEAGENDGWKDYITSLRIDPPLKKGMYYIDYVVVSKSEKIEKSKWYDMYVDYSVENKIVDKYAYTTDTYESLMTTAQLCDLLVSALPEDYYTPINNIKGIPDVSSDVYNSEVYRMLYKAGVLLGLDDKGNLKPDEAIKLCDAVAIIERAAVAEKRIKSTVNADWTVDACLYNLEFEDEACLERFAVDSEAARVDNGFLILKCDTGENTPKITFKNVDLVAKDYTKLRVRMKYDFDEIPEKTEIGMYFMVEGDDDFTDEKYMSADFVKDGYTDPAGWCIAEIDFPMFYAWKGCIKGIRFAPMNINGTFTFDYVRFIKANPLHNASHEKLISLGYVSNGMLQDIGFERGFNIQHFEQKRVDPETRRWQDYCETDEKPMWDVGPWWCLYDLWDNRDKTTDKYTLTDDKGINTIKYNPEEKSLLMRVNATKIYNGEPHDVNTYKWWPHLLLNQHYRKYPVDKAKNDAGADRIFLEMDIKMSDFKNTINEAGANSCAFLLYFYFVTDKAPSEKIWYGFTLFNCNYLRAYEGTKFGWAPDSAAHQYMYGTPQAVVYGGIENSFNPKPGVAHVSDEWKHVRLDITEHIERCVRWANRDKAFGVPVEKKDMFFGGCNIGFEIHGNYDCTFEFKNLDMVAYRKNNK